MISEWTCDLTLPKAEVADTEATGDAERVTLAVAGTRPDQDRDVDAVCEDTESEPVGWFE